MSNTKMKLSLPLLRCGVISVSSLLMLAITPAIAQQTQLNKQKDRISDERIYNDHSAYESLQGRIKALNDTGNRPVRDYHLAKSQCWLDVSFHEYSRNDRSDFTQEALTESEILIKGMESNTPLGTDTRLVNDAARVREDLWKRLGAIHGTPGFVCAQQKVACGEVELVHAGNELNQQQWRHAKPYIQIAEDLVNDAEALARSCGAPVAQPTIERINLNASALFRFNRRSQADLLPAGKTELDQLAQRIQQVYASVERIDLVGYTDRLGSDSYNAQLSQDRADTVKAYLQSKGVEASMSSSGRGEADPVVQCEGNKANRKLTDCLQPNRRVEVTIVGIKR
jgi:OmpA-OmpF porin, OOP family